MSKEIIAEYCDSCEEFYCTNTTIWVQFDILTGETKNPADSTFQCPRCDWEIMRYPAFLKSLELRNDPIFVDFLIEEANDLSIEAKSLLRGLIENFTVPSFSVSFKEDISDEIKELSKKRYLNYGVNITNGVSYVELNAHKLRLLTDLKVLNAMNAQSMFLQRPEWRKDVNKYGDIRKKRIEALPNTFTEEQRVSLLNRFGGKCAFTGQELNLHIDHVLPVASGFGGTTLENMLPIGQRLNSSKGDRNVFDWYEKNGERFEVVPELFAEAITYIAELNEMTYEEYREYVYDCHNAKSTQKEDI